MCICVVRPMGRTWMWWTCSFHLILFVFIWRRPKMFTIVTPFRNDGLDDVLVMLLLLLTPLDGVRQWSLYFLHSIIFGGPLQTYFVRVSSTFLFLLFGRRHEEFHIMFTRDEVFLANTIPYLCNDAVEHTAICRLFISYRLRGKQNCGQCKQCGWHCGNRRENTTYQIRCPCPPNK